MMEDIFELSEDCKTLLRVTDKNVTHVTIPDGVTKIGISAFRDCSGLTSVVISNSVTSIEKGAFTSYIGEEVPRGVP